MLDQTAAEPQRQRLWRRARGSKDITIVPESQSGGVRMLVKSFEQLLMLFVAFISLAPLYVMIITSLKTTPEFRANFASVVPPQEPTFAKFVEAWSGLQFSALMKNSLILSATSAALVTLIAALGGFALARIRFPGRRAFLLASVMLMSVPAIVIIVPLFSLFSRLGWVNTYPAAIVAEIGINVPFAVYLTYTFMREIPQELFRAAEVDGASWLRQLVAIAFPLSRPILVTVALVTAIFVWNDLLVPLILWQSEDLRTLMVGLANLAPGRAGAVDVPLVMAGVCISVLPIVALFILAQRVFVRGLVEGGLK
jgi:ABC-type glycerol-3-phosphate transport system permease component